MTTIYTVEIIPFQYRSAVWYFRKKGERFEAELSVREYDKGKEKGRVGFRVSELKWIDPNHCKIISEIKVK